MQVGHTQLLRVLLSLYSVHLLLCYELREDSVALSRADRVRLR